MILTFFQVQLATHIIDRQTYILSPIYRAVCLNHECIGVSLTPVPWGRLLVFTVSACLNIYGGFTRPSVGATVDSELASFENRYKRQTSGIDTIRSHISSSIPKDSEVYQWTDNSSQKAYIWNIMKATSQTDGHSATPNGNNSNIYLPILYFKYKTKHKAKWTAIEGDHSARRP